MICGTRRERSFKAWRIFYPVVGVRHLCFSSFYFQGFLTGGNSFLGLPVCLAGAGAGGISSPLPALHYHLGHD